MKVIGETAILKSLRKRAIDRELQGVGWDEEVNILNRVETGEHRAILAKRQ